MKRGKKAQFYILAAVIIIALIASLTTVSNYIITKQPSEKTSQTFDDFNGEMTYAVDYCINGNIAMERCINNLAALFSNYTQQNTKENFDLTIYYGEGEHNSINLTTYYRTSAGTIDSGFGTLKPGTSGNITNTTQVYYDNSKKSRYINITINNVEYTAPVTKDNNFIAVMVTTEGYNNYVFTNLVRTT